MNSVFKSKAEEIEWRRSKIIELKSQGLDQREIAQILKVSPASISYDIQCMRKEASENVKDYTVKQLPLQFKICVVATQNAMKQFWNISQNAHDNKEKMQALENYVKCHRGLCSFLWEGGGKLEQFLSDYGNGFSIANVNNNNDADYRLSHDENGRHYAEGEWVHPKGYNSYAYRSNPSHLKRCNEKHDITEQQIEEMKTGYYGVTDKDIEEIRARWWCYDSKETNTKNNTIST